MPTYRVVLDDGSVLTTSDKNQIKKLAESGRGVRSVADTRTEIQQAEQENMDRSKKRKPGDVSLADAITASNPNVQANSSDAAVRTFATLGPNPSMTAYTPGMAVSNPGSSSGGSNPGAYGLTPMTGTPGPSVQDPNVDMSWLNQYQPIGRTYDPNGNPIPMGPTPQTSGGVSNPGGYNVSNPSQQSNASDAAIRQVATLGPNGGISNITTPGMSLGSAVTGGPPAGSSTGDYSHYSKPTPVPPSPMPTPTPTTPPLNNPAQPGQPAGSSTGSGYSHYSPGSPNPAVQVVSTNGDMQHVPYENIGQFLNTGWRPVDSTGQPYEMKEFNGGWLLASNQGWVPFNVYNGQGWLPGQKEAIEAGMRSGTLENLGVTSAGGGQGGPGGGGTGVTNTGAQLGFGSFAQPFSEQFNPNNSTFTTTPFNEEFNFDYDTALQSPAFQRRLQEGAKMIEGSAAARGGLYSGRTGKELMRFGQAMTSDELANEYGRAWNQFQDKKGTHWTNEAGREADYNKALGEFRQRHDIFKGNQTDIFNRFASLSNLGQTTGSNLGSSGLGFGNTLANSIMAGGQALGNGVTNSANARIGGVSNATGNVQDLLLARQFGLI